MNCPRLQLLLLLAFPARAAGQDLMNTPIGFRSGFTEGAATTRPGTLTLDAGASVRWAEGTTTYRVGELNVRAPMSRHLSVAVASMVLTHRGLRPVAALIVRLDTPTGSLPGRERSWRPSARWSLGGELPGRVALHCNVGIARETRAAEDYSREFASVWLSRRLAGRLGAYAEAYGSTRDRPDGPATRYLHGALTYLVRSWIHVDLHAGLGSAAAGSPRWIGIGVRQGVAR